MRLIKGENDLETLYPEIAAEWDYEVNYPLRPDQVTAGSGKRVKWKCKLGHSYPAKICVRTKEDGTGCPYCAGQKVLKGFNDLETLYPEIAAEWDYEANYPLRPDQVTTGMGKEVMWKCKLGHSYPAKIYHRTGKNNTGCPYCAGQKVLKGFNDLAILYPEIAAEWDYEANYPLRPDQVTTGKRKKVMWKCKLGHSYPAYINNRTGKSGSGCPYCAGQKVFKGFNDLATLYPEIAAEWDYEANYPLRPDQVTSGSIKEVIWKCKLGHSYPARIYSRAGKSDSGCPYCAGRKVLKGFNDLETLCPEIAVEWNYEENYPLKPDQFTVGVHKEVKWKCELGHSYSAYIHNRTRKSGSGCPYCAGRKVLKGFNDLETLCPEIAAEWNYEENYPLKPDQVTSGSGEKVMWKCELGHSYPAQIFHRTGVKAEGCPFCNGRNPIEGETDLATRYPDVCKDWDYSKNQKNPDDYTAFSAKRVYWKCHICGNVTKRSIVSQVKGVGCRKCKTTNIEKCKK